MRFTRFRPGLQEFAKGSEHKIAAMFEDVGGNWYCSAEIDPLIDEVVRLRAENAELKKSLSIVR